jgi:hypothetical protein
MLHPTRSGNPIRSQNDTVVAASIALLGQQEHSVCTYVMVSAVGAPCAACTQLLCYFTADMSCRGCCMRSCCWVQPSCYPLSALVSHCCTKNETYAAAAAAAACCSCCYVLPPGGYSGVVNGTLIDSRKDCVTAPGFKHALCVSWRNDNLGAWGYLCDFLFWYLFISWGKRDAGFNHVCAS